MKYLLAILVCAWVVATSHAAFGAPFITSDPDPTGAADKCVYQIGSATPVESATVVTPPALTGNCKIDVGAFPVGTANIQVWFKSTVWGVTSTKVPFTFVRPNAAAPGPSNLQLVP